MSFESYSMCPSKCIYLLFDFLYVFKSVYKEVVWLYILRGFMESNYLF